MSAPKGMSHKGRPKTLSPEQVPGTGGKTFCPCSECFGHSICDDKCMVLSDTDFGGKMCPFYKTTDEYINDAHRAEDLNELHKDMYAAEMFEHLGFRHNRGAGRPRGTTGGKKIESED